MNAVLILHGLGSSNDGEKVLWLRNNLGMKCFAPNFPQHGDNVDGFDVDGILKQVDGIIEKMKVFDKRYLVARSFGGYIGLLILKRYPDFFDKVCFLSPAINMREVMGALIRDGYVDSEFKIGNAQIVGPEEFVKYDEDVFGVDFEVPALIVQGSDDVLVKMSVLRSFLENKNNFELRTFGVGHDYGEFKMDILKAVRD